MDWMQVLFSAILAISLITAAEGLRCYHCSGQTNYDPDHCFHTDTDRTIVTECPPLEENVACEKRVERIDRQSHVINRGCTVNCNERNFVYTDDFQVYCCTTDNCNAADTTRLFSVLLIVSVMVTLCLL